MAPTGRLREIVAELDGVISDIRTTIFDLQTDPSLRGGLRAGVLQLTIDAGERLGFPPRVRFDGPVDMAVDRAAGEQLLAVLRESLSNVIRHAGASEVEVHVTAGTDLVSWWPTTGSARRRRGPANGDGLRNMETRAAALGGTFTLRPHPPGHPGRMAGAPGHQSSRRLPRRSHAGDAGPSAPSATAL